MTCVYAVNSTLVPEIGFEGDIEDLYNNSNCRTPDNTDNFLYNCGGYALETYNWFLPILCDSVVRENASASWLEEHSYADFNDFYESEEYDDAEFELQYYVDRESDNGLEYVYDLLSDIHNDASDEEMDEAEQLYWHHDYSSETALELAALNMLKAFPDMRRIESFDELNPDEYGIAYRGTDWDFHFAKYDQLTDTITHKLGPQQIRKVKELDDAFEPYGYDTKTVFFAKKRKVG